MLTRIIASVDQPPGYAPVGPGQPAPVSLGQGQLRSAARVSSGQPLGSAQASPLQSARVSRPGSIRWPDDLVGQVTRAARLTSVWMVRLLAVVVILWVFSKVTPTTPFRQLRPVTHVNYRPLIRLIPSSPSQRSAISERVG